MQEKKKNWVHEIKDQTRMNLLLETNNIIELYHSVCCVSARISLSPLILMQHSSFQKSTQHVFVAVFEVTMVKKEEKKNFKSV